MPGPVSAVLLAAGSSKRFQGQAKQLLPLDGRPVIRWCADTLLATGIKELVVVLGPDGSAIGEALRGLPVVIAFNDKAGAEMAESARVGIRAVIKSSSGILIALSDHPLVRAQTIVSLCKCHAENPESIIVPRYEGRRGHPTLFPRSIAEEIFSSGSTLRELIKRNPGKVILLDVPDEGVVIDMDTMEDYLRIRELERSLPNAHCSRGDPKAR